MSKSSPVETLYWWIGQVVDDTNWYPNQNPKIHNRDDVPGWGVRYKVRIFGRDTKTKENVRDDQLDWADYVLPVTAGSGHAGSKQSPNIRQGSYVFGFYEDGIASTRPIIFGAFPNHSQTRLFGGDTAENFVPRTGYKGRGGDKPVSTKNIYTEGPSSTCSNETVEPNQCTVNLQDQQKDGSRCHYIPKTKACDGASGELKGIQRAIKNLLAAINRVKAETNSFLGAASDLTGEIRGLVNDATQFISSLVKSLLSKVRGYVVNKLNAGIKDLVEKLPPNQRPGFNQANETATDTLQCVFNKIIRGLVGLIKGLLEDLIDKYINAPMCAIENFIGSILSSILGDITAGIGSALSFVEGIIGKVGDIAGQIFDAFDIVVGILNFLSCDEPLDCTMGEEWSFWGGAKCKSEEVRAGIGKFFKGVLDKVGESDAPPCNTAAFPCGPPSLSVTGGGGVGAFGNPIISITGAILGIDFKSGGSGYVSRPNINIIDDCGNGGGAVIVPILSTDTEISGLGSVGTGGAGTGGAGTGGVGTGTGGVGTGTGGVGTGTGGVGTGTGGAGTGTGGAGTGTGGVGTGGAGTGTGGAGTGTGGVGTGTGGAGTGGAGTGGAGTGTGGAGTGTGGVGTGTGGAGTGGAGTGGAGTGTGGAGTGTGGVGTGTGGTGTGGAGTGTGGTLITDSGTGLFVGSENGIPVTYEGNPVGSNGKNLNSGGTGGNEVVVGGNGNVITADGIPLTVNSVGGDPVFVNETPLTIGGVPVKVGGTGGSTLNERGNESDGGSVVGVIVLDSGTGYLPYPNGDLGGNGQIWASKDQTTVQRSDGTFDTPYNTGSTISLNPGDTIKYPGQPPILINQPETVTAPPYQDLDTGKGSSPSSSDGSYPVVLSIGNVYVSNPGVAYLPNDKIRITPDNGAILEPEFDDQGRLINVSVVNGGIGFTDFPIITIESQQGMNAQIVPVFNIINVGDYADGSDIIPPGTGIISVVDCVGKFK